jgi:23S rRNA (cytidine1920-2'-O)/16S rRNA (cytidine1409-2'-O)-methyltransferase
VNPISPQFVSRGGLKLHHALTEFAIDATGLVCADLGCSTGGFTDCLLQAGAAKVHSVDTAYGELAWKLRNDPRVVVTERTNALHAVPPADGVDLVVVDLGWTVQRLVIPAALKWLRPSGRIITLIKPHYEAKEFGIDIPRKGVLDESIALDITNRVMVRVEESAQQWGITIRGITKSPILGGKEKATGNPEWLALLQRV